MNSFIRKHLMRLAKGRLVGLLPKHQKIRFFLYKKMLGLDDFVRIHTNVVIRPHHKVSSDFKKINKYGLKIGKNCLLESNVDLDTTGNLIIGNDVDVVIDSVIYTHTHEFIYENNVKKNLVIPKTLKIDDGAFIGARVIIVGCSHIGRMANIGAGAVVRSNVPPYAMVIGNPAKIVGFLYTPEEVAEFEKDRYPENERTNIEQYSKQYDKYFINRISEIKKILSN